MIPKLQRRLQSNWLPRSIFDTHISCKFRNNRIHFLLIHENVSPTYDNVYDLKKTCNLPLIRQTTYPFENNLEVQGNYSTKSPILPHKAYQNHTSINQTLMQPPYSHRCTS